MAEVSALVEKSVSSRVIGDVVDPSGSFNQIISSETLLKELAFAATNKPKTVTAQNPKHTTHISADDDSDSNSDKTKSKANIRGNPKSGRFWKGEKKRFRTMVKSPGLATKGLDKKLALRAELKRAKELSRAIIAERSDEREAKKERRRDNIKRAEENKKKSEIVQVITNSAKLKKMKKKQLRNIEKRDTTKMK